MHIIGVIDLLGGRAVHARGGCRPAYRPVETAAGVSINGGAGVLARVYVDILGLHDVYVADLGAIAGGAEEDVHDIAAAAPIVWLDAGVSTAAQAQRALARGASRVVVGLETLTSFAALREVADAIGPPRVAFSLDLRDGQPMAAADAMTEETVESIARQACDAGASALIVLDVARVGSGRGVDLPTIERVRRAVPSVTLLAGGGVRDAADLRRLSSIGCNGALIATALHGPGAADLLGSAAPGAHG